MDPELLQGLKHPKGPKGFTGPAHLRGQGPRVDQKWLRGKDLLNVKDLLWELGHLNALEHLKGKKLQSEINHRRNLVVWGPLNTKEILFLPAPTKAASIPLNPDR